MTGIQKERVAFLRSKGESYAAISTRGITKRSSAAKPLMRFKMKSRAARHARLMPRSLKSANSQVGEGQDILTPHGKDFALDVGNYIREKLIEFQKETGHLYNYEATPADSTAYSLALKDRKKYKDIITRGTKASPYYTNSCHIPVSKVKGLKEIFDHQEELQIMFTGGTVIHLFCQ